MIRIVKAVNIQLSKGLSHQMKLNFASKDERFLRFVDFDTRYLDEVPFFFKPFEPIMTVIRDGYLNANSFLGLPWWAMLIIGAMVSRLLISPLILIQLKRFSKLGPISPVFLFIKDGWKQSNLPFFQKLNILWRIYRKVSKQQKFRFSTIFVYNLAYYPLMISMIYGIRKLLACEELKGSNFWYIDNLLDIDPYFILPTLTIGLYYYNFQRFITKENEKTLMSKIRRMCQMFLFCWFPFLCCWPAGITLYMCSNALISLLQTTLTTSPWFYSKLNQKSIYYYSILQSIQYDKTNSEGISEAIKKGEENFQSVAIKEEVLEEQTIRMLKNLELQASQNQKQAKKELQKMKKQSKNKKILK